MKKSSGGFCPLPVGHCGHEHTRPAHRSGAGGLRTVTPWIISRDTAGLLDFVAAAFDATELARVPNEDGTIGHAEVRIGDSVMMMFDGRPEWADTPAFLRLYVEDGEATFRQALAAGAEVVTELTELF